MKQLFLVLMLSIPVYSQTPEHGLLWHITGPGIEKASYLYAKIPANCSSYIGFMARDAISSCTYIYAEIDIDDPYLDKEITASLIGEGGVHMGNVISESETALLDAFFEKSYGMDISEMGYYHPAMLRYTMQPEPALRCRMFSADSQIIALAKEQDKEIFGLQEIADLRELYDKIPYEHQVHELVRLAKYGMAFDNTEYQDVIELYRQQDINGIKDKFTNSVNNINFYAHKILLDERNASWVKRMKAAMFMNPVFFALPAEHLGGERGLIMQLREEGYTVLSIGF